MRPRTGYWLYVVENPGTPSQIIQGKKAITAETALQLERASGVPANFWNSSPRNSASHPGSSSDASSTKSCCPAPTWTPSSATLTSNKRRHSQRQG